MRRSAERLARLERRLAWKERHGSPLLTPAQNERLVDLYLRRHGRAEPSLVEAEAAELAAFVTTAGLDDPRWLHL